MPASRYNNPESLIGEPGDGTFAVRDVRDLDPIARDAHIESVYNTHIQAGSVMYGRFVGNLPAKSELEQVFAYLTVIGASAAATSNHPIGHAVGSHEKIGSFGRRQKVANIISVFVRPSASEAKLGGGLRYQGVGRAMLHELLDRFHPDTPTAVISLPVLSAAGQKAAKHDLKELGFKKRVIGGRDIYLGPSAQAVQNQLLAENPWIVDRKAVRDPEDKVSQTKPTFGGPAGGLLGFR